MSLVNISFILFTSALFLYTFVNFFYLNARTRNEKLLLRLSREGAANNLIFCSQEVLQNKVMGIDGIHRKIMILEKIKNKYNCSIIPLDEVQHCALIKNCGSLNTDNLKKIEIEKNLKAIELQFAYKNEAQPASIVFYDNLINSKRELVLLKAKAEYWSVMLSKMVTRPVPVHA
ncbi:MAG: hypothetical protein ABI472_09150 [Ginsengibacter sp.]